MYHHVLYIYTYNIIRPWFFSEDPVFMFFDRNQYQNWFALRGWSCHTKLPEDAQYCYTCGKAHSFAG